MDIMQSANRGSADNRSVEAVDWDSSGLRGGMARVSLGCTLRLAAGSEPEPAPLPISKTCGRLRCSEDGSGPDVKLPNARPCRLEGKATSWTSAGSAACVGHAPDVTAAMLIFLAMTWWIVGAVSTVGGSCAGVLQQHVSREKAGTIRRVPLQECLLRRAYRA
jgi:hypothetical protein